MADFVFSEYGNPCTILEADLFQDGNILQVASNEGFPDLSVAPAGSCFLIVLANECYTETMSVTAQNGLIWTVDRAQGAADVPLTFCQGSIVKHPFSAAHGIALNACCNEGNGG